MFGHHKAKRQKKRMKAQQAAFDQEKEAWKNDPIREKEASDLQNQQVADKSAQSKADRATAREEGRADTEAFLNKDIQGLDPVKRQAMQYEANKGIQRSQQSANRKLLGDQATHGIVGKGGVGYAQQRDLQKLGMEAKSGVHRDLDKLNSDLALKKKAAIFAGGEGHASQTQLDKQLAVDELQLADERKRQRKFEDDFYKQFSRV